MQSLQYVVVIVFQPRIFFLSWPFLRVLCLVAVKYPPHNSALDNDYVNNKPGIKVLEYTSIRGLELFPARYYNLHFTSFHRGRKESNKKLSSFIAKLCQHILDDHLLAFYTYKEQNVHVSLQNFAAKRCVIIIIIFLS